MSTDAIHVKERVFRFKLYLEDPEFGPRVLLVDCGMNGTKEVSRFNF